MEELARGIPDFQTHAVSSAHTLRLVALDEEAHAARLRHVLEGVDLASRLDTLSQAELVVNAAAELSTQGHLVSAWNQCVDALRLVPSVEASDLWVPIANNVVQVGFLTGEWDSVAHVAALGAAAPIGRANQNNLLWFASLVSALRGESSMPVADDTAMGGVRPRAVTDVTLAMAKRLTDPDGARRLIEAVWDDEDSPVDSPEPDVAGPAWSLAAELAWRDTSAPEDFIASVASRVQEAPGSNNLALIWKAQAAAHLARVLHDDGVDVWASMVRRWDDMGAPHQAAEARVRLAESVLRRDDRAAAAEALGQALTTAESLGARPLADEIRTLASRGRLRLPGHDHDTGDTGPLTAREHEVLQLLVQGMTNDEIGSTLFMSPRTASVHVSHILAKLQASNRTEVAAVAHRRGLVTGD